MTTTRLVAPIATGAALLVVTLALNGCSVISDTLHDRAETDYATHSEAVGDWGPDDLPGWIPEQATDIRRVTTDDGSEQVVRLSASADLPPECVGAPREHRPFDSRDWIPDVSDLDRIQRCGEWEVTPVDTGYVGWFHASEHAAQSGSASG